MSSRIHTSVISSNIRANFEDWNKCSTIELTRGLHYTRTQIVSHYSPRALTRQAMDCTYNVTTDSRSCNHCCRAKVVSITYSECVFAALVTRMPCACAVVYCHLWPLWLHHIFPHYLINGTIFRRKLLNMKCVCFDFLY
jgi:hypothetical protein